MHYFYGNARGNGRLAARLYRNVLIQRGGSQPRRYPDHRVFIRVHDALIAGRRPGAGNVERIVRRDPDLEENILEEIARDPTASTRSIGRRLGVPNQTVHRILGAEGMHPFHFRKVQNLLPTDYERRVAFCQEMLRKDRKDPNFFDSI